MMNVEDVAEGRWCKKRNEVAGVRWSQMQNGVHDRGNLERNSVSDWHQ